jgi:hypothetical protein
MSMESGHRGAVARLTLNVRKNASRSCSFGLCTDDCRGRGWILAACVVVGFGGASIDSRALATVLSVFQPEAYVSYSFPDFSKCCSVGRIFYANKDMLFCLRVAFYPLDVRAVSFSDHGERMHP